MDYRQVISSLFSYTRFTCFSHYLSKKKKLLFLFSHQWSMGEKLYRGMSIEKDIELEGSKRWGQCGGGVTLDENRF
jgi:hypothetical protein